MPGKYFINSISSSSFSLTALHLACFSVRPAVGQPGQHHPPVAAEVDLSTATAGTPISHGLVQHLLLCAASCGANTNKQQG
jgi:hypothetical protein